MLSTRMILSHSALLCIRNLTKSSSRRSTFVYSCKIGSFRSLGMLTKISSATETKQCTKSNDIQIYSVIHEKTYTVTNEKFTK